MRASSSSGRSRQAVVHTIAVATAFGLVCYFVTRCSIGGPAPVLLAPWEAPAPLPESAPAKQRAAADLDVLATLLEERWAHLEQREAEGSVHLAELLAAARVRLERCTEDDVQSQFPSIVRRLLAGLKDGHAGLREPAGRAADPAPPRMLPFRLADAQEGVVAVGVSPFDAEAEWLLPGDVLLSVDGVPIEELLRERGRDLCASTDAARRLLAFLELAHGTDREVVTLERARRGGGPPVTVKLLCPPIGSELPVSDVVGRREKVAWLDEDVGYYRPGSFAPRDPVAFSAADPEDRLAVLDEQIGEIRSLFERFQDPDRTMRALVLDLRSNLGGTDLLGQELVRHLIAEPVVYFELSSRSAEGWSEPMPSWIEPAPAFRRFLGPLVCLIDSMSFSVTDDVAACLRTSRPGTTFVGRPTGGGTGAPRAFPLPNSGLEVSFCTMRVYDADHRPIEGHGTLPDVPVTWSALQLVEGPDADVECALELLAARTAESESPSTVTR